MAKPRKFIHQLGMLLLWCMACPTASAGELFVAVGFNGEFTHFDSDLGPISPTRNDLPSLQALARSPEGTIYAAGFTGEIFTLDPANGDVALQYSTGLQIRGMAFSPEGDLYIVGPGGSVPYTLRVLDLDDGNVTTLGNLNGTINQAQGLGFSPGGALFAVRPGAAGSTDLFTIDLDDFQTHVISNVPGALHQSLEFTPEGDLYLLGAVGLAEQADFAQVDPATGDAIGPLIEFSGDYRGLAYIPEPATLSLLVAGMLLARRRGKRGNCRSAGKFRPT